MEPTLKTNAYERGTYYFFDCLNWRKVAKVTFCPSIFFLTIFLLTARKVKLMRQRLN